MNAPKIKFISAEIQRLEAMLCSGMMDGAKSLIISTGDISDVDGLYALAEYAKTGVDVLFVMNYPAYLLRDDGDSTDSGDPGKGYTYGTKKYIEESRKVLSNTADAGSLVVYDDLIKKYIAGGDGSYAVGIKRAFTELALEMIVSVWKASGSCGNIYMCIGGVNALNPFSAVSLKNELFVYRTFIASGVAYGKVGTFSEGDIFDQYCAKQVALNDFMNKYSSIRIDFNGSMAFMSSLWKQSITQIVHRNALHGVFVMGGVHSYEPVKTMPSIPFVLNRFSCATMNQLYSPEKTADFFELMKFYSIPVFVVSNNTVLDVETFETVGDEKIKTDDGWNGFLEKNDINLPPLALLASAYYNSGYNPQRKPFDFYVAVVLHEHMRRARDENASHHGNVMRLFFDQRFGIAVISKLDKSVNWNEACVQYLGFLDTNISAADIDFIKQKKMAFSEEKRILPSCECSFIDVTLVQFDGGGLTGVPLSVRYEDKDQYLELNIQYYRASYDHSLSREVKYISGTDLFGDGGLRWGMRIVFKEGSLEPCGVLFDNDVKWEVYSIPKGIDWNTFHTWNNERRVKTRASIDSLAGNFLTLTITVEGPYAVSPYYDEMTPVMSVTLTFSSQTRDIEGSTDWSRYV